MSAYTSLKRTRAVVDDKSPRRGEAGGRRPTLHKRWCVAAPRRSEQQLGTPGVTDLGKHPWWFTPRVEEARDQISTGVARDWAGIGHTAPIRSPPFPEVPRRTLTHMLWRLLWPTCACLGIMRSPLGPHRGKTALACGRCAQRSSAVEGLGW